LRQHRAKAGLRIGVGPTIDLFRYSAWLIDELPLVPPTAAIADGDEQLRWQVYQSIPQKDWLRMSGRQAKVINDQAARYGIPFDGAVINLPEVVRCLHDFLAINCRRIGRQSLDEDDDGEEDNLDLYRGERYLREKLKRLQEERSLIPRAEVHERFGRVAAILRNCGEVLQRQCGRDAHQILDEALLEATRLVATLGHEHDEQSHQ
jgi:hypothetical protein